MSVTAPQTLPGKLAVEIRSVTALREQYAETGRLCGSPASVAPAMLLMQLSLDAAIEAAGSPDIEGQIAAVQDLEGYTA